MQTLNACLWIRPWKTVDVAAHSTSLKSWRVSPQQLGDVAVEA